MCPRASRRAWLAGAAGWLAAGPRVRAEVPPVREIRRGGMIYRRLGQTDIDVSLLSFGSHTDPRFKKKVEHGNVLLAEGQERRYRLLVWALHRGVNLVDTYESEGQWEHKARLVEAGGSAPGKETLGLLFRQLSIFCLFRMNISEHTRPYLT